MIFLLPHCTHSEKLPQPGAISIALPKGVCVSLLLPTVWPIMLICSSKKSCRFCELSFSTVLTSIAPSSSVRLARS